MNIKNKRAEVQAEGEWNIEEILYIILALIIFFGIGWIIYILTHKVGA